MVLFELETFQQALSLFRVAFLACAIIFYGIYKRVSIVIAGNYASNQVANSAGQKLNAKSANRLQRIANKPGARNAQVNRANAAQQAVQNAPIEAGAATSVAGSNAASSTAKTICNTNGGKC